MKKTILARYVLAAMLFLLSIFSVNAQCLTNRLIIDPGQYNGMGYIPGWSDPNWYISERVSAGNALGSPIPAGGPYPHAILVDPLTNPRLPMIGTLAWTGVVGMGYISDQQINANPGVYTGLTPSHLTFLRTFCIAGDGGNVTIDISFYADNYVSTIKLDGITLVGSGWSQPPGTYSFSSSPAWHPTPYTTFLTTGPHTLEIEVQNDIIPFYEAENRNPIGLCLSGTLTSATAIIVDDLDGACNGYACDNHVTEFRNGSYLNHEAGLNNLTTKVDESLKNSTIVKTDKAALGNNNELYQNNPNPFGAETSIGYNIVKMQQSAFIAIYDLNGRELYRYAVTTKGKGSVTVSGDKLLPGQYLYSLIVDGRKETTRKMVVSK